MIETRSLQTSTTTTRARWLSLTRSDVLVAVLVALTMLMGGYFRFVGWNWDDFFHFHPDERYLTSVATRLGSGFSYDASCQEWDTNCLDRLARFQECYQRNPDTGGRGGYFDTQCSVYHPENVTNPHYVYGTLPLFMARAAADLVAQQTGDSIWTGFNGLHLVWRALSASADMLVILLVFFIGVRLHGKWVGLLASILYAAAVLPIQQSHFGTTDATANLFVILGIFFAVRAQDSGSLWDYGAFGLALGAAVASRVNIAPLAGVIVVVALLHIIPAIDRRMLWSVRTRLVTFHFAGLVLAAFLSLLAFRVFQPYAFAGPGFFGILPAEDYIATLGHAQYGVSGEMDSPPNWQWVGRTPYLFAWQNMVLWGMGIALGLTGWLAWAWNGLRLILGKAGATRNIVLFSWVLGYFLFAGGMWVMSMRYYLPLYAPLALLAAWGLVELVKRARRSEIAWKKFGARVLLVSVTGLTVLWAFMFTNVYRNMATFTQASHWVWENIPGNFAMSIDEAGDDVPLINIPLPNAPTAETPIEAVLFNRATRLTESPYSANFTAHASGTISMIQAAYLGDPQDRPGDKTLEITITRTGDNARLATANLTGSFPRDAHPLGQPYRFDFDEPFQVEFGQTYLFSVRVSEGAPLISSGSTLASELSWEEIVPNTVCRLPLGMTLADSPPSGLLGARECNGRSPWEGLLNHHRLDMPAEDTAIKRDQLTLILDEVDYLVVPTNRRYDSHSRNPLRWPLTNRYYEALFAGEFGFDLVAKFQETFELGPLRVSDQHLPIYDSPEWLNEFEAEEAFHVYDHPVVFIFRKTEDYSPANTRAILHNISLTRAGEVFDSFNSSTLANVMTLSSLQADEQPSQLYMTPEMREIQTTGGTWAERFNTSSIVNTSQPAAVIVWWLAIMAFGLVVWPLMFVALPALGDRGYGIAKFTGILVVAWGTWFLASLRVPVWSGPGILGGLVFLGIISSIVVWRVRGSLWAYLRTRWKLLVGIEALTLILFLAFIGVRLTNPDLWHSNFGGEKPMDFAYFNGILRSTVFPPIDPWHAGGYINYYYFGFVIVGAPTLLTGIVPSLAYNLILPTLFAVTGMAAFSVAFSVVNGWRVRAEEPAVEDKRPRRPLGSPWLAGIAAMLLAVVLGNLGTVHEVTRGLATLGGYDHPASFQEFLFNEYSDEYAQQQNILRGEISGSEQAALFQQAIDHAAQAGMGDRLRYELYGLRSVAQGLGRAIGGQPLPIGSERWFWGPTRIIAEASGGADGAIHEMPYFTFLYADLHAHMIAMPMMLFALAFVYNELMTAGRDGRRWPGRLLALFFGALTVGLFIATNTWDYPTFMILSVLGLGYAWWLAWKRITRWSLLALLAYVGGFLLLAVVVALPFTTWFASGLTQFKVWDGPKTPLWAYVLIHGLFLFLVISLLIWETGRWMRAVKVSQLRGRSNVLVGLLAAILFVLLVTVGAILMGYPVALFAIPLVGWVAILFFRPGQSRSMQYILVLIGLALSITMGTELITLAFDNGRQNTIFKFYIQVWLILSVVGGAAFAWLVQHSPHWPLRISTVWYVIAGVLIFIATLFPLMATQGKAVFRLQPTPPLTLDGMDYLRYARHHEGVSTQMVNGQEQARGETIELIHDYNAIRWLQENAEGSPVIMEALSQRINYQWGNRISKYTGLPAVIGWDYHQRQQRSLNSLPTLVNQRRANVNAFYTTRDIDEAVDVLHHYEVRYIIVTAYEQARYTYTGGLDKFLAMVDDGLLTVAYEEEDALIYEVIPDALQDYLIARAEQHTG
jgi:YYY domain-containing protein